MFQYSRVRARRMAIAFCLALMFAVPGMTASAGPGGAGSPPDHASPLSHDSQSIGWGSPFTVDYPYSNAWDPKVGVDASGSATAVWSQVDGPLSRIYASRYLLEWGWGVPTVIATGNAYTPEVSVASNGAAFVAWSQSGRIWANRYTGSGWGTAAVLTTSGGSADDPHIAASALGDAVAVWRQQDGAWVNISAALYTIGSEWGTATVLATSAEYAYDPQVAVDAGGNALAVWNQGGRVYASRYVAGVGWDSASNLSKPGSSGGARVAMDAGGNATVVWTQDDGTRNNVWASYFRPGFGWGSATLVETSDTGNAYDPQVATDGTGNATVVWDQWDGVWQSIYANRYTVGTGWGSAALVENYDVGGAYGPRIAVDPSGNGIVVWQGGGVIFANRYTIDQGWGAATTLDAGDQSYADSPRIAVDASGSAIVVWDAGSSIEATRFVVGDGWDSAAVIATQGSIDSYDPQIAVNENGDTVIVWRMWDGARDHITALRYHRYWYWDGPVFIEGNDSRNSVNPRVGIDAGGNTTVVWQQWDGVRNGIWANRYTVGAGWGVPIAIENGTADSYNAGLVVSPDGSAIALWWESGIWASEYAVASGWGTPSRLAPTDSSEPDIGIDASGNAIVVWTDGNIHAGRYVVGTGWETATTIETDRAYAYGPQVAVDLNGNAMAVWIQGDREGNVWANGYTAGSGWGQAIPVETHAFPAWGPDIAVDAYGDGTAVWVENDEFGRAVVYANRFAAEDGWDVPTLLGTRMIYLSGYPQIAMDSNGNATAVWIGFDGTERNLYAIRYTAGTGWGSLKLVNSQQWSANEPHLAVEASGTVTAVWNSYDGTRSRIWAAMYTPRSTPLVISLTSPVNGATVDVPTVTVEGSTEPEATVTVNGVPSAVDANGSFSAPIVLSEGLNTIIARAQDGAGNVATASIRVVYRNLASILEDRLRDTNQALQDTTDALDAAIAELKALRGDVLVLLIVQIALAVSTAVLFFLYWSSRRPPGGSGARVDPSAQPIQPDEAKDETPGP